MVQYNIFGTVKRFESLVYTFSALQRFPGGVRFEKGQGYSIRLDNLIALLRAV